MTRAAAIVLVATLAVAGAVHLGVAPSHTEFDHRVFFIAVGIAQVLLAGILAFNNPKAILIVAATLSVGVAVTWAVSRAGWIGSSHSLGVIDTTATAAELATVGAAVTLLVRGRYRDSAVRTRVKVESALAAAVAGVLAAAVAWTAPASAHGHDAHHAPAEPPARTQIFGDLFEHHSFDSHSPGATDETNDRASHENHDHDYGH